MKLRFGAIALALLVVVAATGCGSKKKAAVTTSAAPAVTTTATTTSGGSSGGGSTTTTAPVTTVPGKPSFDSIKSCGQLESIGKKFSAEIQASAGSNGKVDFTKEAQLLKALADASPSAIHGDFETLATAFGSVASAYQKANITPGKTPTPAQLAALASVGKAVSAPKVIAAEQHLETWASTNCAGFKTTTG